MGLLIWWSEFVFLVILSELITINCVTAIYRQCSHYLRTFLTSGFCGFVASGFIVPVRDYGQRDPGGASSRRSSPLSLLSLLCLSLFLCRFFASVFGERRSGLESEDRQGKEEEHS
jgi:hypothetical protein